MNFLFAFLSTFSSAQSFGAGVCQVEWRNKRNNLKSVSRGWMDVANEFLFSQFLNKITVIVGESSFDARS